MFGIGFSELIVIAIVALIFVGPKRLPEVMRQAGKLFVHVRRTANDVKGTFDQVVREAEDDIRRQESEEMRQLMSGTAKPVTTVKAIDAGVVEGSHAMGDHPLADHPADHPPVAHAPADHSAAAHAPAGHPAAGHAPADHSAAHPPAAEPPKDS